MSNLNVQEDILKPLAQGFIAALAVIGACYLAVLIYQLGYIEGEYHATQKSPVEIHNLGEHRARKQSEKSAGESHHAKEFRATSPDEKPPAA